MIDSGRKRVFESYRIKSIQGGSEKVSEYFTSTFIFAVPAYMGQNSVMCSECLEMILNYLAVGEKV